MALLEVKDLKTRFRTDDGVVKAVDGVSFTVEKGQTLGIVGESGCGKSVTCLSIMGLHDHKKTTMEGSVLFDGQEILGLDAGGLRHIRGNRIAMIFQDPMTSLNPVKSIGWQLSEAVLVHQDVTRAKARDRSIELLREVGIPRAEVRIDDYPHQFSGGMRQRVMIAMALINEPEILIADEPTTALDVTTQAQIIRLIEKLQRDRDTAVIMITHDLGVVAEIAEDVAVMYAGRIVEQSTVDDLFDNPQHPYTWGLLGSLPSVDRSVDRLAQIPGQPPSLLNPPVGCAFSPRCSYVFEPCVRDLPDLVPASPGSEHLHRCHLSDERRADIRRVLPVIGTGEAA
jgi:oligopeptide/dipeptide ABC transporter ATP-binding protein